MSSGSCAWFDYDGLHRWSKGITRDHTRSPNKARYLPAYSHPAEHECIERGTVAAPTAHTGAPPLKRQYLRRIETVIGWDDGQDALLSYVECSGGSSARTFHGRPMRSENPTAKGMLP